MKVAPAWAGEFTLVFFFEKKDFEIMTYRDELRPWAIFRYLPDGEGKNVCVYRFKTRPDADAYASILRQGGGRFDVVFDQIQPTPQEIKR